MKLGTNIQHLSGLGWKGFQGERSKVKVTANALFAAEVYMLTVWHVGRLVFVDDT